MELAAELGLGRESLHVCDVGAAFLGQRPHYHRLLEEGTARLFAFEPDEDQHEALRPTLPDSAVLLPYALGDGRRHTLHVAPGGMTSLLEADRAVFDFFTMFRRPQFAAPVATLEVDTRRLDDVAEVERIDLLKIDVQGAELMVLQNAREKLAGCAVIQIEVPFVRLYRDQPGFAELDAELSAQGFMVHGFASLRRLPIAPWAAKGGLAGINQVADFDLIYIRDFLRPQTLPDPILAATALIADRCYGSYDLAVRAQLELERRGRLPARHARRYFEQALKTERHVSMHGFPAPSPPLDAGDSPA